ncbi:glutaredoxin family protein [Candidatus Woesearchaeota archaeon]|nr:glutaredoxin family protein [Candidatus Woesearchaeota archaeon]
MTNVTVYSTNACPWCTVAKNFFKEKNIKFTEKNVQTNREYAQEMIKKSGQMGVPVIEIGSEIIIGFDQAKIKQLLKIK